MILLSDFCYRENFKENYIHIFKISMLSIAVLFLFIVIPANAEEYPVIETGYTYIDGNECDVFSYPAVEHFSHLGLSKGEVAYSKNSDPLIYLWSSETGETKTFDTTEIAERKDNWISFWMEIRCLDISDGVVYYSLLTHKTTGTGTSSSPDGLFSFDGLNNVNIDSLSDHGISDLLADNSLVLMKDSWYDPELFLVIDELRVYYSDSGELITVDDKTEIDDLMGFGEYKVATLARGLISHMPDDRIKGDGIIVFDISPALAGGEVEQITIPEAIDITSDEKVEIDQDCFSDRYFVWSKGWKITESGIDRFESNLYMTNLNTLQNTVIDTKDDLSFGLYAYAVDDDYLIYKNDDRIFLYHIPDGDKKEIRITGNDKFEVGDIVEFDEGQLLVRAYPKEYVGYEPSEYEIWFVDLNPYINPAGMNDNGGEVTGAPVVKTKETPVILIVPGLAVLIVFALFAVSLLRKG